LDAVFPKGLVDAPAIHTVGDLPLHHKGAHVDRDNGVRQLYVKDLQAVTVKEIRDVVVEVLDLADERVEADEVVFVLEKKQKGLKELLQGLLYVGGTVVRKGEESEQVVLVAIGI
jgi:hypothetical protein